MNNSNETSYTILGFLVVVMALIFLGDFLIKVYNSEPDDDEELTLEEQYAKTCEDIDFNETEYYNLKELHCCVACREFNLSYYRYNSVSGVCNCQQGSKLPIAIYR